MNENNKINREIVILVIIVIVLILSLLGILLYVVNEQNGFKSNKNTTTRITTTSSTTTVPVIGNDESVVSNAINDYLVLLENDGKISEYQIEALSLLDEESVCSDILYNVDKMYASVKIVYKRLDNSFMINSNDDNSNTDSDDVFEARAIFEIGLIDDVYQVENLYTEC